MLYLFAQIFYAECPSGEYTIPSSMDEIPEYQFLNCQDLTSIIIPNHVSKIGARAFEACSNLQSVSMTNNVTSIGEYAFFFL